MEAVQCELREASRERTLGTLTFPELRDGRLTGFKTLGLSDKHASKLHIRVPRGCLFPLKRCLGQIVVSQEVTREMRGWYESMVTPNPKQYTIYPKRVRV